MKTLFTMLLSLSLLYALAGCSKQPSELERYEKLTKELMEQRKIDITRPVVATETQKFEDEAELVRICDQFMGFFGKGRIDDAFDLLDRHSPWPKSEMDELRSQTKSMLSTVRPRYGGFAGHELIKSERVGQSIVKYVYLAKLQNHGLRCNFTFCRAKDRWTLNSFVWDDKIQLLEP